MTSPCGKIRIPINESSDDKSQIAEYLDLYHGEGIQHIALGTDDIYATVDGMRASGVAFQDTIDTYYDLVDKRLPGHGENVAELKRLRILIDGATHQGAPNELLLQIFTQTVIGPIFFEIIQRKGDQGFGEGNFRALFESIELDQMRRGVLQDKTAPEAAMNAQPDFHSGINQGVAPVTYGQGDRPPRGDYAQASADYTCEQDWERYTAADHDLYRRLYERQAAQLPGLACEEFIAAVQQLGAPERIPRFDALSEKLHARHRLGGRGGAGADPRGGLLRAAGAAPLPGDRLDPQARGVRLRRRARRLPRPVRPCAAALQPDVRRLHAGLRRRRPEGEPARGLRVPRAAVLVHGGVRPDRHAGGAARLRRGHPVVGRRTAPQRDEPRAAAHRLRPASASCARATRSTPTRPPTS